MNKRSIILFSGGLDSTTCLYLSLSKQEVPLAISFDYAQRHSTELERAKVITRQLGVEHQIIKIDAGVFTNSSLVNPGLSIQKGSISTDQIPNTYVPGRNILFLSYAVSIAEGRNINDIYIGVNALDYSGYPDCRPMFIESFRCLIAVGTKAGTMGTPIEIHTPLISKTKKEIALLAHSLGVPIKQTFSCYDPINGEPCGQCESCLLRKHGLEQAGLYE
jgi:7-cyano-7-deazaguanine synthase